MAALGVHDGFADGQSKAAATVGAGTRFVSPVESLENVRKVICRDALPGIGDGEKGGTVFTMRGDTDLALSAVIIESVRQEVGDDLANSFGVAEALGHGQVAMDWDAAFGGERADEFDAVASLLGNRVAPVGTRLAKTGSPRPQTAGDRS